VKHSLITLLSCAMPMVVYACADASFEGATAAATKSKGKKGSSTDVKGPQDPITPDEDESDNVLRLRYGKGVTPKVADYLFVMDNSVSMGDDMASVSAGLSGIPKERFPASAKLAVMTTMAANDPTANPLSTLGSNLPVAQADIDRYTCIDKEPGFLDLVNADAVLNFTSCQGPGRAAYSTPLCEDKWFAPYAVNSGGQRCFTAAFQNPRHPVGCEPGLLALKQLFQRHVGKPLFRDNAAVNVIFVSDEMDGCKSAAAKNEGISAATMAQQLKDAAFTNSKIASFKLHGIIPASVPVGNLGYQPVIQNLGGYSVTITSSGANYSGLIEQVVDDKVEITSSEFALPTESKGIIRIEIDGVATKDFTFVDGSRTVKVNGLDPSKPVDVAIRYKE